MSKTSANSYSAIMLHSKQIYMLQMMRSNDTLTVKRAVLPEVYLRLLQKFRQDTGSKHFRLESLGSAIPNLVKVAEMLEVAGVAQKRSLKMKHRRLRLNNSSDSSTVIGEETVVCKFLECVKVEMEFFDEIQ